MVGLSRQSSRERRVVLPLPDGPNRPIISPSLKFTVTSATAWTAMAPSPYVLDRLVVTMGSVILPPEQNCRVDVPDPAHGDHCGREAHDQSQSENQQVGESIDHQDRTERVVYFRRQQDHHQTDQVPEQS